MSIYIDLQNVKTSRPPNGGDGGDTSSLLEEITQIKKELSSLREAIDGNNKEVDVVLFAGQSNMAGRGDDKTIIPSVDERVALEFRAVSDPTKLYPITIPFGAKENNDQLNDGTKKSGGMVSSFLNAMYNQTKRKIIAVSASQGGTSSEQWKNTLATEAIRRFKLCLSYLSSNGYTVKNVVVMWCQGETDGDNNVQKDTYKENILSIFNLSGWHKDTQFFIVRTGDYNGSTTGVQERYVKIQQAQNELCQGNDNIHMASMLLSTFKDKGYMIDNFHYKQKAYNLVGIDAGNRVGRYLLGEKEQIFDDNTFNQLFIEGSSTPVFKGDTFLKNTEVKTADKVDGKAVYVALVEKEGLKISSVRFDDTTQNPPASDYNILLKNVDTLLEFNVYAYRNSGTQVIGLSDQLRIDTFRVGKVSGGLEQGTVAFSCRSFSSKNTDALSGQRYGAFVKYTKMNDDKTSLT